MTLIFKGVTEFANACKAISDDLKNTTLPEILSEAGNQLVTSAQGRAPVDTGFLRDNIKIAAETPAKVTVVSEADYSIYVENGTSRAPAQPFMGPATQEVESSINSLATQKVKATITQHWK